jgi:hypothetical protein
MPNICSKSNLRNNDVHTLNKELTFIRKQVCAALAGNETGDASIVNIADDQPDTSQSNTIQILNNGDVYVVDVNGVATKITTNASDLLSTNTDNTSYEKSDRIYTPVVPLGSIIYHQIEAGAITDNLIPYTKAGAISSATITKSGNFDSIAVTGGTNTSILHFDDKFICDTQAVIRISVIVTNLNADGSTGTSKIGLGTTGVQNTGDTGTAINHYSFFDVIGKTGVVRGGQTEVASSVTSSGGTLVANGQILDLEFRNDLELGLSILYIVNRSTGEFAVSKSSNASAIDLGMANGKLRVMLTNATYTILSLSVSSSGPRNSIIHVLGDSMANSYNTLSNQTLVGRFRSINPLPIIVSSGNGAYWKTIATLQMQEVFKIQPKYVLIMSILPLGNTAYDPLDAQYAAFIADFNSVMSGIISYGGVPILTKWGASNFYGPTIGNAWNAFLDDQKLNSYPTMQFLDLTQFPTLQYNDFFGHPSSSDWVVIASEVDKVLKTLNY